MYSLLNDCNWFEKFSVLVDLSEWKIGFGLNFLMLVILKIYCILGFRIKILEYVYFC